MRHFSLLSKIWAYLFAQTMWILALISSESRRKGKRPTTYALTRVSPFVASSLQNFPVYRYSHCIEIHKIAVHVFSPKDGNIYEDSYKSLTRKARLRTQGTCFVVHVTLQSITIAEFDIFIIN